MTKLEKTVDKLRLLRLNSMADYLSEAIEKEKNSNLGFLWLLDHLI